MCSTKLTNNLRTRALKHTSIFLRKIEVSDAYIRMYLISNFPIGLDIDNCTEFFADAEVNALARVRNDYEKKCLGGQLILRVLSIVEMSDCAMKIADQAHIGCLSLIFRALTVEYKPRDVVAGATIKMALPDALVATTDHMTLALLRAADSIDAIPVGASTVLTTTEVSATAMLPFITATGVVYEAPQGTLYYQVGAGGANASSAQRYALLSKVMESAEKYPENATGATILEAARDAKQYMEAVFAKSSAQIIGIVRSSLSSGKSADAALAKVPSIDILANGPAIDVRAGQFIVMSASENPIDGKIYVVDEVAPGWQKADLVMSKQNIMTLILERYITLCHAAATMAIEWSDNVKSAKSVPFFKLLGRKRSITAAK